MNENHLTGTEVRSLVNKYIDSEGIVNSTQAILDSGLVTKLTGFKVYPGKVSDSIFGGRFSYTKNGETYECENPPLNTIDGTPIRIMVRTQRISTHDLNRGEIPFKDQILASNHHHMRRLVSHAIGTSQINVPGLEDNSVVIAAENLTQIPFENVLRAYMAKSSTPTSLFQAWSKGEKEFASHKINKEWFPNCKLPYVMDTPSTKSDDHDETLSPKELFSRGICTPEQYMNIRNNSLMAFGIVSGFLRGRGIILVDTKTEHGINREGEIVSQDELYTMDSSRFWLLGDYMDPKRISYNTDPMSYSKEFAREFSKGEKGYTNEERMKISMRYIIGIQHLLDKKFQLDIRQRDERVVTGLQKVVEELSL
ncbi:MAG: phosphoribosylaminoimidazolesuccinocarboxamide synthase [Candidatus Nanoarchaeia archaeon]|jgi:phosphoribosylaminoimidazole-succinocarboxamide synthase|nr:phosphoribosylaminoimidazolesuccinocarboxamide synthase [Candidatus Nanoarchaeia archaeon]|tara:strand:- start:31922 stop:33022 length:1101 start_codon:yes stop_codon:yes gene_type:complete